MGASVSKNATKIVLNAVAKISSEIIQTSIVTSDNSQIISISDTKGDVIISGNTFIQMATINTKALFEALAQNDAQQKLAVELAQSAKSLTSGLNIGQFSSAENDIDTFVSTSIDIISKIGQTCNASSNQYQKIQVQTTQGDVKIVNNVFSQISVILSECVESSVNKSSTFQSVVEKFQQDASATSQGLSEWGIIAIIALIIGVPSIGTIVFGKELMKNIFPMMILAGIIMTIIYYVMKTQTMKIKAYSNLIENTPACEAQSSTQTSTSYATVDAAAKYCNSDANCVAFDWKGSSIDNKGTYTKINTPQSKFYTSVDDDCRNSITTDNMTNRTPILTSGKEIPNVVTTSVEGDIYIDATTSDWYQLLPEGWIKKATIILDSNLLTDVVVMQTPPSPTMAGTLKKIIIVYLPSVPHTFYIYDWTASDKWALKSQVKGPGLYTRVIANTVNASGVKEYERKTWLLYSGIAVGVLGLLGTIMNRSKNSQVSEK